MLRYMRPAGGGLAAVALTTAGAYFVAVTTGGHPAPWWPYVLLFGLVLVGGLCYVVGPSDARPSVPAKEEGATSPEVPDSVEAFEYFATEPISVPEASLSPGSPPGPVITDRWHHTSDGAKVPALMSMTHTGMSHRAYGERPAQDAPPSVKIGMLVACQPTGPAASGTGLRAKFTAFLDSPAVRHLIAALTDVQPGMSWQNLAGNGPRMLEAALASGDNPLDGVPAASALFLPPTPGESLYGRNGRAATLILYIEPRTADGRVPPASDLAAWYNRFWLALSLPVAFADFLAKNLGFPTSDDPPAQLGIWLQSNHPLTAMVDTSGVRTLPGSWQVNRFTGWAFTAPDGGPAKQAARDLTVQLCEYSLYLDAYEHALPQWLDRDPIIPRTKLERSEAQIALSDWLAALFKREGVTIHYLAKRLDMPVSVVAAYLSGQSMPLDKDRLERLLQELNANYEESEYAEACWADHRIGMAPRQPPDISPRGPRNEEQK